ncbi:sugar ABC transporter ATP-binding protein [Streptomyces sp. SCSIO ZS0520]|uniref:sugar ABC transporter ATP-binding protein n=1 Tax=Streptomyces sp. SCSIO ZS0520 TaxID=2892996 RepID=UPI0021D8C5BE|nr:sugar ABC transporter ATP-binding protein [Streptomyces sp. SCSIO ZS0520]
MTSSAPPLLAMRGIAKSFPGVRALSGVDLTVHAGEVVALLGENGAGKSTLMNILAGVHADYEGSILRDGEPVSLHSPRDAAQHGIAMIHQELNLVPELSVAENVFLGREPTTARGTVRRREMEERTTRLLAGLGLDLPPRRALKHCQIAERQLIEVAKALSLDVRILVMDEPTSALADAEVRRLHAVIRGLTARGVGVVYISHRLEELAEIADSVTVLRDGVCTGRRAMAETSRAELVRLMVGRPLDELYPRRPGQAPAAPPRLSVRGLRLPSVGGGPALHGIDLTVAPGEIVGLAGLMGAGRTEVLQSLFGHYGARASGEFTLDGRAYRPRSPGQAIRRGLALVAEDRKAQSLVLGNTVRFNASLAALGRFGTPWRTVRRRREAAAVRGQLDALAVRTPGMEVPAGQLSGGNQQKVVLAKCLLTEPGLLLMDEPTRGIDIGAKAQIHTLMDRLAQQGTAILAVSSELPELIGMCDRILVLCEGRLTGEFHRDPARGPVADEESLLTAAMARRTVADAPKTAVVDPGAGPAVPAPRAGGPTSRAGGTGDPGGSPGEANEDEESGA